LFNRTLDKTTVGYTAIVKGMLRKVALVCLLFVGLLVATYFGITSLPTGFVPSEDEGYIMVAAQLPDAASLGRTQQVMDEIYEVIAEQPGIRGTIVIGGYSLLDGVVTPNAGACWVVLDHWDDRDSPETQIQAIVNSLNARFVGIKDAMVFAVRPPPIAGLGTVGGFEMQVQDRGGVGLESLQQSALDLIGEGRNNPVLTGLNTTFRSGVPQIYVNVDRVKAKRQGIPLSVIFNTLQANLGSAYVNDFNLFGRTWKVYVQADEPYRVRRDDITQLEVRSKSGRMVPLSTLVEVSDTVGPTVLKRHNLYAAATVTGDAAAGFSSGQAVEAVSQTAGNVLPPSMGFEWSGVTFQEQKAGGAAGIIFGLALVFVYLFLAAQYESWTLPLGVMFSVPIAVLGASLATMIRSLDNNVYTQIGLVLLVGLAAKTAILIVEFANQQRQEGKSAFDAALTSARLRFRPILMTAFSFILGVLPLLIATGAGAVSRRALGTAVFGGMLLATVVGVFLIPFLYFVVQRMSEAVGRKKAPEPVPEVG
jgi:HAE1 family hydrophobic/amphiphilic exporter-1